MNRPRVWPIFVAFIVAAVATAVFAAGVGMLEGGLAANATVQANPRWMLEAVLATQAALLVAVLCFARPLSAQRLGLARGGTSAGLTLAAVAGTVALGAALDSAGRLLGLHSKSLQEIQSTLGGAHGLTVVLLVLAIGPMAAFFEELFFRGYMQRGLGRRWRPSLAILFSSLCFGLFHFDLLHSSIAVALGLWLGLVAERAASVRPSVIAHATNNTLATLLALAGLDPPGTTGALAVALAAVPVLIASGWYLLRGESNAPAPVVLADQALGR
jgi:membrane protease YdiL (CAAX protease family)